MKQVIRSLIDFHTDLGPRLRPLFKTLAHEQNPELLLITCSDSRVMPHVLTGAEPGGVFTVRTVGNLVAPAGIGGLSVGDVSEAAAVEYAVEMLGIRDIAVCGHSNCGAMRAIEDGRELVRESAPNLAEWLAHAEPAVARRARGDVEFAPGLNRVDQLSQVNVLLQLEHIASFAEITSRKDINLHALWFDIEHTMVSAFDKAQRRFVPLDEAEIVRVMSQG